MSCQICSPACLWSPKCVSVTCIHLDWFRHTQPVWIYLLWPKAGSSIKISINNSIYNKTCFLSRSQLDRVVDRVKPWFMVHGLVHESWFCSWFCSQSGLWFGSGFGLWYMVMVSLIMFFFNMVDYPLFFPLRSTLTLDTIATLSGT